VLTQTKREQVSINDGGLNVRDDLLELISDVATIPFTFAAAEHGFITMILVCSPFATGWLGVKRLSKLVFVGIMGQPLDQFETSPCRLTVATEALWHIH